MNRLILAGAFGTSSLLLLDSAAKGSALLLLAAIAVTVLRRDSAATRHLVWLLAVVAMLVVPILSAILPEWRVLPEWAGVSPKPRAANNVATPAVNLPSENGSGSISRVEVTPVDDPPRVSGQPVTDPPIPRSLPGAPEIAAESPAPSLDSPVVIPYVWATGFAILVLRLLCARWLLYRTEVQSMIIGAQDGAGMANDDSLRIAFESACLQIGLSRPVKLLTHPDKTIPLVWGVFRQSLLLPTAARDWSDDQLRSVLLHELAHIRRRDTLSQLLTQIACALYWFNPLVWVAAWRLGVERERACDDLVLASGVRPSAYAGHLLEIVTSLSSARWVQPCGVAMARTSSLEGRLVAVLSKNLNRRGASMALRAIGLFAAAGVAVPMAMLCAADKPWYSPSAAHIGSNRVSTYCIHDGKNADFVIVYRGSFNSSSDNTSNAKARTWSNSATLTLTVDGEKKTITLSRKHTTPDSLILAGKNYDLKQGRVFLVDERGQSIRQCLLNPPAIHEQDEAETLAKQIAALLPQGGDTEVLQPKHEYAQALFRKFQALARTDGRIPGALIGRLRKEVDSFLEQHPDHEKAEALAAIRPRLDRTRDWSQAEVITILDEMTTLTTAPVSWTDLPLEFSGMKVLQKGRPLPDELSKIAWGTPAENGLRAAWLLEPSSLKYPLGSVLKSRVLFHNTGNAAVIFTTDAWHQYDEHSAKDADGAEIKVSGAIYSGITPTATFRLAPGEFCEVQGHGIAIGAGPYTEEHSVGSVGAVIEAKERDVVGLTHTVDATQQGAFSRPDDPQDPHELWKKHIAERIALEGPMPASAADREQLIRRVMSDLFGELPTDEEVAQFTKAESRNGLQTLITRLQKKPQIRAWSGKLPTGETKFRVTAADPEAAKAPRTANGPGRYILDDNIHLLVSQITTDARRTNKAVIAFLSPDPKVESPHQPFEIALPDGLSTWGAVWERGSGVIWTLQKGLVRKFDFSNPDDVKESRFEGGSITDLPELLRASMKKAFDVPDAPVQQQNNRKPNESATLPPEIEKKLQWGEPAGGLRMALIRPQALGEKASEEIFDFYLVVQNVAEMPIRLDQSAAESETHRISMNRKGVTLAAFHESQPAIGNFLLQPREMASLRLFSYAEKGRTISAEDPGFTFKAELTIENAPAGSWTGSLVTGDTVGTFSAFGLMPESKSGQSLFSTWNAIARSDGTIPGALIGELANSVKTFIKNNPTWKTTPQLVEMLPDLDATRDWPGLDAIALLDRLAAVQDTPIAMAAEHEWQGTIQAGMPLPASLNSAPWGPPDGTGLRHAWLLDPNQKEYRIGTPLKARVLIHNTGKKPVVFRGWSWQQAGHTARDARGTELAVNSVHWTTLGRLLPYRLAPGEFVELNAAGIGVGANKNDEDWQHTRVGTWIDAKAGDEVTVTTTPVLLSDKNDEPPQDGQPGWWYDLVTARLARHRPLPAGADERRRLLYRIAMELFGTPVNEETNNAFVNDKSPTALESLAKVLSHRARMPSFSGKLQSGPTTFRVLPVDPDAAKKPRIANNPGRYTVSEGAVLEVSRRPVDERVKNEAHLQFFSNDPKAGSPGKPITLRLPDGYDTWAAGWVRGAPALWVMYQGKVQHYDFTDPAQVVERLLEGEDITETVPGDILDALRTTLSKGADAAKDRAKNPPAAAR